MPSPKTPDQGLLDFFGPERAAGPPGKSGDASEAVERGGGGKVARSAIGELGSERAFAEAASTPQAPPPTRKAPEGPRTYQVSELVRLAGRALESRFPDVWVEGEVSNLRTPGHVYFTLKDAEGQLPAVMFRSQAQRMKFRLTDGLKVRARGRVAIYDAQGKLQLYVEQLEPAGLGALQLAFEQLKKKLEAEGLFADTRKRPLPFLPRRIGVATSATGAAVRDIVRVALRRGPTRILIAPCLVQGDGAPADIVRAIAALQRQPDVDLLIVGRGGGSAEDLAAFNDEAVARAIAACRVPVISAVGHEVDFTIADFVADRRAATPSQAAELAVPEHEALVDGLDDLRRRLARASRRQVGEARIELDGLYGELEDVLQRSMRARSTALGALDARLRALHPRARLSRDRALLDGLRHRLERPMSERLVRGARQLEPLGRRLHIATQQRLTSGRRAFETACGKLDALSPLRVIDRGYSLVRRPSGAVVTAAAELAPGDSISVLLRGGSAIATVETIEKITPAGSSGDTGDTGEPEATARKPPR